MAILAFPVTTHPARVTWGPQANTQQHRSPFNGSTQTLVQPGGVWTANLSWPTLSQDDWRLLSGFVARLSGSAGRFTYGPVHAPRRATGTGTPVMNGSIQTGTSISIKGWAASAQAFKTGDFLSYLDDNGRSLLHIVVADSAATGSGFAAVDIWPPVRRSVPDGRAVEVAAPVGVFRLAGDANPLSVRPGAFGELSLDIEEALV